MIYITRTMISLTSRGTIRHLCIIDDKVKGIHPSVPRSVVDMLKAMTSLVPLHLGIDLFTKTRYRSGGRCGVVENDRGTDRAREGGKKTLRTRFFRSVGIFCLGDNRGSGSTPHYIIQQNDISPESAAKEPENMILCKGNEADGQHNLHKYAQIIIVLCTSYMPKHHMEDRAQARSMVCTYNQAVGLLVGSKLLVPRSSPSSIHHRRNFFFFLFSREPEIKII